MIKVLCNVRMIVLEYYIDGWVYKKISHMKGVTRIGMKGKFSPQNVGPCQILRYINKVSYELDLSDNLALCIRYSMSPWERNVFEIRHPFSLGRLGREPFLWRSYSWDLTDKWSSWETMTFYPWMFCGGIKYLRVLLEERGQYDVILSLFLSLLP